MSKDLIEIRLTPEAYAVIQQWIRSGSVSISEAIIIVNDQIVPRAIDKWRVKTKVKP